MSTDTLQVEIVSQKEPNVNLLKQDNIRIFSFRNKYLLVNSYDGVFMMFEVNVVNISGNLVRSVQMVMEFSPYQKLSSFPAPKQISYSSLRSDTFFFISEGYKRYKAENEKRYSAKRCKNIKKIYKTSTKLAMFLADTPTNAPISEIMYEIEEAGYYLTHNNRALNALKHGTDQEQRKMVKKLFSSTVYSLLGLKHFDITTLNDFWHEVLNYTTSRFPLISK